MRLIKGSSGLDMEIREERGVCCALSFNKSEIHVQIPARRKDLIFNLGFNLADELVSTKFFACPKTKLEVGRKNGHLLIKISPLEIMSFNFKGSEDIGILIPMIIIPKINYSKEELVYLLWDCNDFDDELKVFCETAQSLDFSKPFEELYTICNVESPFIVLKRYK